ncbi:MAG: energy-coupling factor ABC transporter ATP-binding protein [Proteobacteria bacterium]|nr:energy-coupling factor ABC transporter ATP-binding protein [Pseudomonadota bacterium]
MSHIEIKNLGHRFPNGHWGINEINLSVEQGSFVIIAGKNGSGKTTFCRHLNGLLSPTTGSITIDGLHVEKYPEKARRKVGMVFQNANAQIVGETVYSDVAFGPENLGLKRAAINQRVEESLELTGLTGKELQSPHTLSGGEKRKLAIAGVLAMNPDILIFDEPFSNLDYPGSILILKQILDLHESGHTIFIVTHELEKTVACASQIVLFENGSIVKTGSPLEILEIVEQYGVRLPCSAKLGQGIQSWLN